MTMHGVVVSALNHRVCRLTKESGMDESVTHRTLLILEDSPEFLYHMRLYVRISFTHSLVHSFQGGDFNLASKPVIREPAPTRKKKIDGALLEVIQLQDARTERKVETLNIAAPQENDNKDCFSHDDTRMRNC